MNHPDPVNLSLDYRTLCEEWLSRYGTAFLTPSCTSALEIACRLSISPGDEVILPSFTFSSCANAIILAGGVPVFVDIRRDTLNIDWNEVLKAATPRTKAVMPVWYAGVSPEVQRGWIQRGWTVIEDAAQAIGNFDLTGDFGCFSFHKTKNVSCGEGGALIVKDPELAKKAQIYRNCGTTCAFEKDWDWVSLGTHALMNESTARDLWQSLESLEEREEKRRRIWKIYHDGIRAEEKAQKIGNSHIFWFLTENREDVLRRLNERGIKVVKHYTPLHSRKPGLEFGRSYGTCPHATFVSERILRPPMTVSETEAYRIVEEINKEIC